MRNPKEVSRQPSERLSGHKSSIQVNDNGFLSQIHYKCYFLQLPPIAMNKDRQYEFMKKQIQEYLLPHEYDAAIKFICDLLDY